MQVDFVAPRLFVPKPLIAMSMYGWILEHWNKYKMEVKRHLPATSNYQQLQKQIPITNINL